jgi:rSAM/selenodomain-associated transferase 1
MAHGRRVAALGIMCKAPRTGAAKTRLAGVVGAEAAARLAACFLADVAEAVEAVPEDVGRRGYGVYAPRDGEVALRALLPPAFGLVLQEGADLGVALAGAVRHFLEAAHDCVVLVNGDSPTLPTRFLVEAIALLRRPGDRVVLGPATDGGYYLIGLKRDHPALFRDIPWSTPEVCRLTQARAGEIGLEAAALPVWYDVDDAESLACLAAELAGTTPPFAGPGLTGGPARATRACLASLR